MLRPQVHCYGIQFVELCANGFVSVLSVVSFCTRRADDASLNTVYENFSKRTIRERCTTYFKESERARVRCPPRDGERVRIFDYKRFEWPDAHKRKFRELHVFVLMFNTGVFTAHTREKISLPFSADSPNNYGTTDGP